MENSEKIIITPRTKVMQLIETWPQLEDVLIGYVPAFSKLKNPVLRKTVARIATLQQAASVGNVKVEDLINHLRKEVGQDLLADNEETGYTIAVRGGTTKAGCMVNSMSVKCLQQANTRLRR
jgi:hypothetical protein